MTNKLQYSTKSGDDILLVGGDTTEELLANLAGLLGSDRADGIVERFASPQNIAQAVTNLQDQNVVPQPQATVPRPVQPAGQPQYAMPQQQQQAQPSAQQLAKVCAHGLQVRHISGIGKASGKPYSMLVCPNAQGQQCDFKEFVSN